METKPGIISADYKAEGGKLLRVHLEVVKNVIQFIKITGDFFMHPEEAIEALEQGLTLVEWNALAVREKVQEFFNGGVEVVGAGVEDFVTVVMRAR